MNNIYITGSLIFSFLLTACGGGGSSSSSSSNSGTTVQVVRGVILHAKVTDANQKVATEQGGGYYKFSSKVSYPIKATGGFIDVDGDGKVSRGDVKNDLNLTTTKGNILTVLTTLASDPLKKEIVQKSIKELNISQDDIYSKTPIDSIEVAAISNILYKHQEKGDIDSLDENTIITEIKQEHSQYIDEYENGTYNIHENEKEIIKELEDEGEVELIKDDDEANEINSDYSGIDSSIGTRDYTLIAWNDLGMHCMDGKDYSVFSILPPYNNLNAQLIKKAGTSGKHITSGVTITYESQKSLDGKLNTTSIFDNNNNQKTNFWDYVSKLFNTSLPDDTGLSGNKTPSLTPSKLKYNSSLKWWEATGLPITPYNDDGSKNYYPLVKVTAKDSSGKILATTQVVLPVSDELDCKSCHSSNSNYDDAKPSSGWVNLSDLEKDFKYNILKLHDQKFPNAVKDNLTQLQTKGYNNYNSLGLYQTAQDGNPILCATCHKSNALPGTGITGIKPLTEAIHSLHANVIDPIEGVKLNNSKNRSACYRCHPGATTKCLRGAMGKQSDIQCQSCHGNMDSVGKAGREGWLNQPNCQACHQNAKRYQSAFDLTSNTLRASLDKTFATNPNTPMQGISLYRYSTGHGKLQCSACHGSTHAIYPSSHKEDNLQSIAIQGHEGTIAECSACHSPIPFTTNKGPHGMHTIGQAWVDGHEHVSKANCNYCHGADYRGSELSKTFSARTFRIEDGRTKSFSAGYQVSCYDCHNGPSGEDGNDDD